MGEQFVPAGAPDDLVDVPADAAEMGFQFLDDLAVAAHGAVQALQVAVDHEDEVVETLARGEADGAHRFRFVHLAVAEEGPDLAAGGRGQAAGVHVFHETRLVDRHQRAEAHGDGGELPEVAHGPGVRVGRDALALDLLAEVQQVVLIEPAFEEGAGVNAGGDVALEEDHVGAVRMVRALEEMVVANFVHGGGGGVAADVAADAVMRLVGLHHHRHRVPADQGAQAALQGEVARVGRLGFPGNGVDVGSVGAVRGVDAVLAGGLDQRGDQVLGLVGAFKVDHGLEGVQPFLGLVRIVILICRCHAARTPRSKDGRCEGRAKPPPSGKRTLIMREGCAFSYRPPKPAGGKRYAAVS